VSKRFWGIIAGIVVVAFVLVGFSMKDKPNTKQVKAKQVKGLSGQKLYDQAQAHYKERELVKARDAYQKILTEFPDFEEVENVQNEYEKLNMKIIFSNTPTEDKVRHEVQPGDTLGELAKQYGTTIHLIKLNNNLKSDIIRIGQKLQIWTGTFNILIDKSQNVLFLKNDDDVIKTYTVSTGENNSTPVGDFNITSKLVDPVWFNRGVIVPPESPQNVLGSRWLGFDLPGYGIHGTIKPGSIGTQETAGCVRMHDKDVEELYSLIPFGTKVTVVN